MLFPDFVTLKPVRVAYTHGDNPDRLEYRILMPGEDWLKPGHRMERRLSIRNTTLYWKRYVRVTPQSRKLSLDPANRL